MSGYGVHISFGGKRKVFSGIWSFVECRKIDPDDWMLSPDLFKLIANKWVLLMWTGQRAVTIHIRPIVILSFGVLALRQWIA